MPRPTTRSSRPTAKRVRFATTATVYGEDCAPASAPVRGGPRLTVRSRRPGPSSSSSKSTTSTSNVARSAVTSSRPAASRPRTPSVTSPTLSTWPRPFRSVSFALAAARPPTPPAAPAPAPVPVSRVSSVSRVPAPCPAPVSVSPRSSRFCSVSSRSVSPPAASIRSKGATEYRIRPWTDGLVKPSSRPRSPLPVSRPLLTTSVTRRMDEVENGIRRLREETRTTRGDHHRMDRPRPAAPTRPRRTPTSIDALAAPRPRNPTPAAAKARNPIKAPAPPSVPIRVPRTRPHAPAPAKAEPPRSRNPIPSSRHLIHHSLETPRIRSSKTPAPAPAPKNETEVTRETSIYVRAKARYARIGKMIDELQGKLDSWRRKSNLKSAGAGRTRPRHVTFNEETETTIVERWITKEDVYPEPPRVCGSLQGWKTEPLPRPTDDGEELHYTTYWCSVQCSQLTHSHYRPCGRPCAWNRLAQIHKSKQRQFCTVDDDLAYHSTAAVFDTFNKQREELRKRGVDLL